MSNLQPWITVVSSFGAGGGAGGFVYYQMRKLLPAQKKELEASSTQMAMETVESALTVARVEIATLQTEVNNLTGKIGELRGKLQYAVEDRDRLREELTLAIVERAKLQDQINHPETLVLTDAIVITNMKTGLITWASEGIYSLLGYVPKDLIGQPLETLVPEDKRSAHTTERRDYAKHPKVRDMGSGIELFALTALGRTIPVDISLHPTDDGHVIALLHRRMEKSKVKAKAEVKIEAEA